MDGESRGFVRYLYPKGVPQRAGEWGSPISHRVIVTTDSSDSGTPWVGCVRPSPSLARGKQDSQTHPWSTGIVLCLDSPQDAMASFHCQNQAPRCGRVSPSVAAEGFNGISTETQRMNQGTSFSPLVQMIPALR